MDSRSYASLDLNDLEARFAEVAAARRLAYESSDYIGMRDRAENYFGVTLVANWPPLISRIRELEGSRATKPAAQPDKPASEMGTGATDGQRSGADRFTTEADFQMTQVIDDESGVIEVWNSQSLAEQSAARLNRIDELERLREAVQTVQRMYPHIWADYCAATLDAPLHAALKGKST